MNARDINNLNSLVSMVRDLNDALRKSDAQRDELQRMLTACEQEMDLARRMCKLTNTDYGTLLSQFNASADRIRTLEEALRKLRPLASCNEACFASLECGPDCPKVIIDAAVAPAPPAETTAPTCKRCGYPENCHEDSPLNRDHGFSPVEAPAPIPDLWKCQQCSADVIEDAMLRAELGGSEQRELAALAESDEYRIERDRLRADLAAANERADEAERQRKWEHGMHHEEEALHAATKARLGRAVAALRETTDHLETAANLIADEVDLDPDDGEDEDTQRVIASARAILADDESKDAGEAWREMEAVYEAGRSIRANLPSNRSEWFTEQEELVVALAAVNARRGVKP